ncbi:MAG: hypothetical protein ACE5KE_08375, partial [Methanosarcinales archaeon]
FYVFGAILTDKIFSTFYTFFTLMFCKSKPSQSEGLNRLQNLTIASIVKCPFCAILSATLQKTSFS